MKTAKPAELVEEWILEGIRTGSLKPGDHIPHLSLARKLNVSNNPVIQILRRLEGQGILDRGADGICRVRVYSMQELYGALAVRGAIESAAARFCAEMATDEEMAVIGVRYDKMVEAYHGGDYAPEQELAFHSAIVEFCHAPFLLHIYDTIMLIRQTFTLRAGHRSAEELIERHAALMNAIRHRDADEAERIAAKHVAEAQTDYLSHAALL